VNFARYLHENRGNFIDHRADGAPPPGPGVAIVEVHDPPEPERMSKRRRLLPSFRPVMPAFAPSLYATPLPYIEPWERR
jgi:hypothetical protein